MLVLNECFKLPGGFYLPPFCTALKSGRYSLLISVSSAHAQHLRVSVEQWINTPVLLKLLKMNNYFHSGVKHRHGLALACVFCVCVTLRWDDGAVTVSTADFPSWLQSEKRLKTEQLNLQVCTIPGWLRSVKQCLSIAQAQTIEVSGAVGCGQVMRGGDASQPIRAQSEVIRGLVGFTTRDITKSGQSWKRSVAVSLLWLIQR